MAEVTITIPNSNWSVSNNQIIWNAGNSGNNGIDLGTALSSDGATQQYLVFLQLRRITTITGVSLQLSATQNFDGGIAGPDFSDEMEMNGTIVFTASDGSTLTITGIGDTSDPYNWSPSNINEVAAFANTVAGLSDRSMTVVFNDQSNLPPVISNLVANPMSVANGGMVALSADVTDPNMDLLTYQWTASPNFGTFADATAKDTTWTAHSPGFPRTVLLTLTANDGTDSSSSSVMVMVQGVPRNIPPSPYCVLVDVNDDGSYSVDIYPEMTMLQFSAGATGARREGLAAKAGMLTCRLNNSNGLYQASDLENKRIRVRRNGLYIWGGRIDRPKDRALKGTRRTLAITAKGILNVIGGAVQADVSHTGDIPASDAVEDLTGLTGIQETTQEVHDWEVDAGDDILRELRAIQDSSGTRVYEDGLGDLQLAGQGIAEFWDVTLADDEPQAGDKRSRWMRRETPKSSIVNAVVIDGTKYTDSDSVDAYGEVLHPSDFEFAVASEADTIAADIFSLYAEPPSLYTASFLLEQLAGATVAEQNEILRLLHYGNERLLTVRFEGQEELAEIIEVKHQIMRGERHIINLDLRGRTISGIALTLNTVSNEEVGYFVNLPARSADGARAIVGHKMQFREEGTMNWTDAISSETGLALNDTFSLSDDSGTFEVRAVALSSGDTEEQTTPTQTVRAFESEFRYREGAVLPLVWPGASNRSSLTRNFRIYGGDAFRLPNVGDEGVNDFEYEYRWNAFPDGYNPDFYLTHQDTLTVLNPRDVYGRVNQVLRYHEQGQAANPLFSYGLQLRCRAVFNTPANERSLWTPWIDAEDITVTY